MDKGLAMVIGMTIAYIASFLGLALAWYSYRKHHQAKSLGKKGDTE
jgi:uncharacterized membrane protein